MPDGNVVLFTPGDTTIVVSVENHASFRARAENVALATPFAASVPAFFSHQWTGTEPHGPYTLFLLAVRAGALRDGVLDDAEVLGVATAGFSFQ